MMQYAFFYSHTYIRIQFVASPWRMMNTLVKAFVQVKNIYIHMDTTKNWFPTGYANCIVGRTVARLVCL